MIDGDNVDTVNMQDFDPPFHSIGQDPIHLNTFL